jgi:hypothetical protein
MCYGRNVRRLWLLPVLLVSRGVSLPIHAQQADSPTDVVREVVEQSEEISSASANARLKIWRRRDLENLLLTLEPQKPARDVYFYELQSPLGTVSEAPSVWVVAVARFGPDVYKLYRFPGSAGADASSQEFNRFTSQLALLVPKEKAPGLARLFLESCVERDGQETVLNDEMELRLAVQNYYVAAYGDLWRGLDAYSRWWQAFQVREPDLASTVAGSANGGYRVVLNTLVAVAGKHPRVRKWELEISPEGQIRVSTLLLIFPDQPRWLFYDLDPWSPFPSPAR